MAAVGGWTLLTVLPEIDLGLVANARKPIIGYSDLTCLLNYVTSRTGLVTYYGPMVLSELGEWGGCYRFTTDEFLKRITSDALTPRAEQLVPTSPMWTDELLFWDRDDRRPRELSKASQPIRVLRSGEGSGRLFGGSLLSLGLTIGTPYFPDLTGSIVCLEIDGMAPDQLHARVSQLSFAGAFADVRGVVVGRISRPHGTANGYLNYDEALLDAIPHGVPVVAGADIGHADPMLTLPLGSRSQLAATSNGVEWLIAAR
jgi:putative carboxypeptidase VC_A0337